MDPHRSVLAYRFLPPTIESLQHPVQNITGTAPSQRSAGAPSTRPNSTLSHPGVRTMELKRVEEDGAMGILIAPCWATAFCIPRILNLLYKTSPELPPHRDLLLLHPPDPTVRSATRG